MGALFDFKCACDSSLVYVCQADAVKMHFCVDYFVTKSPAHSPGNRHRLDFSLNFFTVPQRTENAEKTKLSRQVVFSLFWSIGEWQILPLTGRKKSKQCPKKNLQMLQFCNFAWNWMGPINCALNPCTMIILNSSLLAHNNISLYWVLSTEILHQCSCIIEFIKWDGVIDIMQGFVSILSLFRNEFIMLDSICHRQYLCHIYTTL